MALTLSIWAQGPNGTGTYYQAADGKKGAELKTALFGIIRGKYNNQQFTVKGYSSLKNYYSQTDYTPQNKIWDIYSVKVEYTISNAIDSGKEGDGWNKEHTVPQSWFGEQTPMKSDLFHVYPVDAWVNSQRGSNPFAKVGSNYSSSYNGFSKWGNSATSGVTGTVFEPNDLYKGDLARTYFYMVTCYEDKDFTMGSGSKVMEKMPADDTKPSTPYPGMKTWAINLFLDWSHTDQVSAKEINRNNAVCNIQFNRNPFIDYPGLEQYIWGSMKDVAFSYDNYQVPENYSPYIPGDDPGPGPGPGPVDPPIPAEGENLYLRIASASDLEEGAGYIIVCEDKSTAMAEQGSDIRNYVSLTPADGAVTTEVNKSGKPYELTLGTYNGKYTLFDATGNVYLVHNKGENKLYTASAPSASGAQWTITFSGTNAVIGSTYNSAYSIQYNSGSPRFACYKSAQQPVQLYKRQPKPDDGTTIAAFPISQAKKNTIVYDLQGRPVGTTADAHLHLKKGIYIIGNRKVVIR